MAFRQQVERLTEETICPVCLDFFTDPVILDCGHNFCRSCITQCWEKEERNCCPQCREEFADRTLRVNRALASLAENVQKLKLNVKETEIRPQCEKHQEELKLFCDTDKQLICLICRDAREHKSHNFMPIVEAVEIYKNQVESSLECLREKKSAIQQMEQRQKQKISGVREQSHTLQANITSQFGKMHQVLTEREQRLLGDLREEEERILNTMENNLREIQENLTSVEERLSTLQEQMDQKDSVVFLKEEVCQERRVSEDVQALSVAEGALPVGKLRDTVLREMFDAMKQVSETLDVESASPCLEVSEDLSRGTGTETSLPDIGNRQGLSDLGDWGMKLLSEALRDPECKIQRLGLKAGSLAAADVEDLTLALSTNRSLTEVELDLACNDLGDSGVKLVSEVLRNPECKIHKLGLQRVGLTAAGVVDLASALSTNRSLTEMDLGDNDLGDSGVKLVSEALRNPECKIHKLGLEYAGLTAAGVVDLASTLSTNRSLAELNLGDNKLGDSGVKLVSEALRNPECKIHKLGVWCVGLTAAGVVNLVSALSTNRSLTELNLGGNKLGDSGVKLVSEALRNPECKIHKLGLQRVGLTAAGVVDLASALSTNCSMTELDLIDNKLGDLGVKLVSEALRNPECKIHKLWLGWTGLTDSGTNNLVSALSTNRSLRELNLQSNSLTDRSVPALRRLTQTLPCLEWLRLGWNQFSSNGRDQLKSLAGTRARLRVVL